MSALKNYFQDFRSYWFGSDLLFKYLRVVVVSLVEAYNVLRRGLGVFVLFMLLTSGYALGAGTWENVAHFFAQNDAGHILAGMSRFACNVLLGMYGLLVVAHVLVEFIERPLIVRRHSHGMPPRATAVVK